MTTEKQTAVKSSDGVHLVNPAGAIHEVTRKHAKVLLRKPGWRPAQKNEIAALEKVNGLQTAKRPLCERWMPLPGEAPDLPEALQ